MNIVDVLQDSGLTGRGGAAFSTAIKVRAAIERRADLIVNACDGELGAIKDGWVVTHQLPDLIRGSQMLSPRGARVRFAAHRGSATEETLKSAGLQVMSVPHRYVSSEETALISLAHGGLARPMTKRQPPVNGGRDSSGRRFRPTLVLNAETVWRAAQIVDRGSSWFRSYGTEAEPGPRLVGVTGHLPRPTVLETEAGTPLRSLMATAGIQDPAAAALLVGGLGGGFLEPQETVDLTWSRAALAPYGVPLGPGLIELLDPSSCPLHHITKMIDYAAGESAGQCGPCMFGLPAVAAAWRKLVAEPSPLAHQALLRHVGLLPGRGACKFPDGVATFTRSALRVHDQHLAAHGLGQCPTTDRSASHAPLT